MSEQYGHIEIELEFPINIQTVLSVNFSIQNFKLVFDFLLSTLRSHAGALNDHTNTLQQTASASELLQTKDLLSKLQDKLNQLENTQNEQKIRTDTHDQILNQHSEKIETEHQILTDLQKKVQKLQKTAQKLRQEADLSKQTQTRHEQEIKNNTSAITVNNSLLDNHQARLEQLENQVKAALEAIQKLGGDIEQAKKVEIPVIEKPAPVISKSYDSDIERLGNQIQAQIKLQADLQNNLDSIFGRLDKLDQKSSQQSVKIEKSQQQTGKIREMADKNREEIQNKVNSDDFDRLQQYVYSLGQPSGSSVTPPPAISSKDLNLMRELANRLDTLQNSHNNLHSQVQQILSKLRQISQKFTPEILSSILDRLNAIQKILPTKADKSELEALKTQIIRLKADLDTYSQIAKRPSGKTPVQKSDSGENQRLNSISRRLQAVQDHLNTLLLPEGLTLTSIANDLKDLKQVFKNLQNTLSQLQKDLLARLKALQQQMKLKASQNDLKALQENLQAKIIAVCQAMGKRFADKNETKKALKYLQKLIKEYIHQPPVKADGSDAMFARKPLGGWSCASCAKALEKLLGKIGPYQVWNRLPYRDPSDRIARAGPGFSRMLATVQPQVLGNRTKNFNGRSGSPQYEEDFGNTSEIVSLPPVMKQDRPNTSYNP